MDYSDYKFLQFERRPNGVLLVTINRPEKMNAATTQMHGEFVEVWRTIRADDETRVAVVTGAGRAFSVGGDLDEELAKAGDAEKIIMQGEEARALVWNMIDLDKPVISAINGPAAGAGLAVALSADISIIAEDAKITDAHTRIGVASGDHAVLLWPLYCGMPKAKLYLLTADLLDGKEAERIGLVSMCVPREKLMDTALGLADRLALMPQRAIRFTKRCLNHWLRLGGPAFDLSTVYESLNFMEPDAREGLKSFLEKRAPNFPSAPRKP